jgi:tetratricopeptide (TPR) repeat protein
VPFIHDFDRLQYIFIVQRNQEQREEWIKNWSKIKGIYTDVSIICDVIKQTAKKCVQNAVSFNLLDTSDKLSKKKLNQLNPMFMYSQLLTDITLEIQFEEQHFIEFIDYCRQISSNNDAELKNIEKFQQNYHTKTPIAWYTSERFLYTTLNRGLRIVEADTIIKMGCFLAGLYRQIEQLHTDQYPKEKPSDHFIVYRGQVISYIEFEQIKNTIGGLIAFNSFLSISTKRTVSSIFAGDDHIASELVSILLIITVDPPNSSAAFASIKTLSQFPEEEEILFVMHAVFRIVDIKPMFGYSRLFEVELVLTNETDQDLRMLQKHIRESVPSTETGWRKLADVLLTMGQPEKGKQIYETQMIKVTTDYDIIPLYGQLGASHLQQGNYKAAIEYYDKALEMHQRWLPSNHPQLADSYINIGNVHFNMGDFTKALSSYEKAFKIQKQLFPSNHPNLATSYNNIGLVYSNMCDFSKALSSYEEALEIQKKSLPSNHPELATSYNNIGNVYFRMGEYSNALSSYEKALEIRQQSLPSNHPHFADSYNNIGNVYFDMGDFSKGLSSYEKALEVQQGALPSNHPDLAGPYNNIGNVYFNMGDFSKALSSHEKALEIQKKSLPVNDPHLADSYLSIGNVYFRMSEYSNALSFYEKALDIQQQALSSNHPDLANSHTNIGNVYLDMGNYSKALSSYEEALAIRQRSLTSNHLDFVSSYNNIGTAYFHMGDCSKGRFFTKRALEIAESSLSRDHPTVKMVRENMTLFDGTDS